MNKWDLFHFPHTPKPKEPPSPPPPHNMHTPLHGHGVSYDKRRRSKPFVARIKTDGVFKVVGYFANTEDARSAVDEAFVTRYLKYATPYRRLNYPERKHEYERKCIREIREQWGGPKPRTKMIYAYMYLDEFEEIEHEVEHEEVPQQSDNSLEDLLNEPNNSIELDPKELDELFALVLENNEE